VRAELVKGTTTLEELLKASECVEALFGEADEDNETVTVRRAVGALLVTETIGRLLRGG
jgi:hypothetical protein